jgi:hypothetical protein
VLTARAGDLRETSTAMIRQATEAFEQMLKRVEAVHAGHQREFIERLEKAGFQKILDKLSAAGAAALPPERPARAEVRRGVPPTPRLPRPREAGTSNGHLKPMHRAMLTALAQHAPEGLTKRQILVHTTYASSGPVSTAFADLVREGWIVPDGNRLRIVDAGYQVLGDYEPLPVGDDLREWLLSGNKLNRMEKALLAAICTAYPQPMGKGEILEKTGYASSGPVSAAFAKLVAYNYAVPQGKALLKAAEELFS